ncbi:sodium:proton antiporter NhaD [Flavobacteriaceae bacterium]|jgi:Na+/H+ antiporter NhaD/arsenite permease-like protein|uniref:sodium:proton antiporter NhaD n=1 Tax=Candidatus Arcticimaribacter forsetii TaxID=2820661 RepID=UPI0020777F71|nr:sodium:proton antiporter NhaD [Candidatus Arcticimaribacter forsetii]MCH1539161.1 sodium:proton antiporter NhaD [Flavobacteriaceae bacterium]MDA8698883.1 sodium:proton antiporter NhaD [Flavobacteriaceae bacterium]MDB2326092.1 sodium:proton antiporter NhaD [Flavobacteriaceae bacterium]MDB4620826.1 sodium:proton antiporter NhaD [Flavobacteriaceae bacterium]MDB4674942.1 sodium:proton antiporter NhaD [Flavobacteriaceae bacterium]
MEIVLVSIFVLGYLAITLEHSLKVDKLIPALAMMAILWALIALNHLPVFEVDTALKKLVPTHIDEILLHHLGKTAEIIIFLLGAMTIVEIIDYFNGFSTIKSFIKTKSKKSLLWIFATLAFILSAIIDNLTATIVLITILQKVISDRDTRLWFAGLIIIAANAGGAWSPIGDVTTTMLWIADKVTTLNLIKFLLIPSLVCVIVPVLVASMLPAFKGEIEIDESEDTETIHKYGSTMLYLGLTAIVFVPVFKTITHLPPYVGMMFSLAIVSTFAEIFSAAKINITSIDAESDSASHHSPVHKSLSKIELPSILFFLGILLAVAALESLGMLFAFAETLNTTIPNTDIVIMLLGFGSAVIDNVPLVAASIGMFSEPTDSPLWHFIAFSAGTGGSMLIIGSAAGVVAMGMEKIDFFWYFKKISWLALIGFISGSITFMLLREFIA